MIKSLPFLFDLLLLLLLNLHFSWLVGVPEARVLFPRTDAMEVAQNKRTNLGNLLSVLFFVSLYFLI